METVVDPVVAEEFELLDADRRRQDEGGDPVGRLVCKMQRDRAPHTETEDVEPVDGQPIEQLERRVGVTAGAVVRDAMLGGAEAGQVGRDGSPAEAGQDDRGFGKEVGLGSVGTRTVVRVGRVGIHTALYPSALQEGLERWVFPNTRAEHRHVGVGHQVCLLHLP